jgi:hypothetical protein
MKNILCLLLMAILLASLGPERQKPRMNEPVSIVHQVRN